ncbi:DUF721 domain-containing protein [Psychrobium sp. 1_MG-2023]|uniref:DUF721 domain-containing protein n=1 Tax=Psychrobium sp. 1_MG-2023 TaxID=3062624 RepID=UPI000C347204|nr:DciA family protein [Psychrobium sp. 1_MG-2023]MDP2561469.1 DciA family protein [Psychrobium sp. 1_MG-2023]PKF57736.1 DUF721 domain-containing protein [Alteromonadales bacterium alter-6D02]
MNQRHTPDSIHHLMTSKSGKLAKIQQKASQLQVINLFLTTHLLPDSENYCRVANLRQGVLVIEVASGVWSTRLLQLKEHFLLQIRQQLIPNLANIEIKVNPQLFVTKPAPKPNSREISAQTAEHLNTLAEHAPAELAEKLQRLAKLARRHK